MDKAMDNQPKDMFEDQTQDRQTRNKFTKSIIVQLPN